MDHRVQVAVADMADEQQPRLREGGAHAALRLRREVAQPVERHHGVIGDADAGGLVRLRHRMAQAPQRLALRPAPGDHGVGDEAALQRVG
ncbi:hypothetical protein D3C71_2002250 [compost metagenome]